MTPEQLRTIDALVAKHIFGHEVVKTPWSRKNGRSGVTYSIGEPHYHDDQGSMYLANPLPSYATDIAAAWEVVEKLKLDWSYVALSFDNEFIGGGWNVSLSAYDKDPIQVRGQSTAPLAICLAALRARGIEVSI